MRPHVQNASRKKKEVAAGLSQFGPVGYSPKETRSEPILEFV